MNMRPYVETGFYHCEYALFFPQKPTHTLKFLWTTFNFDGGLLINICNVSHTCITIVKKIKIHWLISIQEENKGLNIKSLYGESNTECYIRVFLYVYICK